MICLSYVSLILPFLVHLCIWTLQPPMTENSKFKWKTLISLSVPVSLVVRTVGDHSLVLFLPFMTLWTSQIPVPYLYFSLLSSWKVLNLCLCRSCSNPNCSRCLQKVILSIVPFLNWSDRGLTLVFKKEANARLSGMAMFPVLFFVSFVTILHCLLAFLMMLSSELLFFKKCLNDLPPTPPVSDIWFIWYLRAFL